MLFICEHPLGLYFERLFHWFNEKHHPFALLPAFFLQVPADRMSSGQQQEPTGEKYALKLRSLSALSVALIFATCNRRFEFFLLMIWLVHHYFVFCDSLFAVPISVLVFGTVENMEGRA